MPKGDDPSLLTVAALIAQLREMHPDTHVRVGVSDGRGWPMFSTPVNAAYFHPGACGEGGYTCLEISESWSENR